MNNMNVNMCVISTLAIVVMILISYGSYIMNSKKYVLTESQDRRISTIILMMLFFVLSLIYDFVWERNTFLGIWFLYAIYHSVKEIRRVANIDCSRRIDDIKAQECSTL